MLSDDWPPSTLTGVLEAKGIENALLGAIKNL
jgi:hypothetical protein